MNEFETPEEVIDEALSAPWQRPRPDHSGELQAVQAAAIQTGQEQAHEGSTGSNSEESTPLGSC